MTTLVNDIITISQSFPRQSEEFTKENAQAYLYSLQKFAESIQKHLKLLEQNYQTTLSVEMKSYDLRDLKIDGVFWAVPILTLGSTKISEFNFIAQPQYHHLLQDGARIKVKQTWKILSDFISAFHQHNIRSASPCNIKITSNNVNIELQALLRETQTLTLDTANGTLDFSQQS